MSILIPSSQTLSDRRPREQKYLLIEAGDARGAAKNYVVRTGITGSGQQDTGVQSYRYHTLKTPPNLT